MKTGNEKGMVLLLVLVVVALLSALLSDLAFSTLVDLRLTETFRDTTRAEYLARGGITAGRMILQIDKNGYDARDDMQELWSMGVQDYPLAEGSVSVQIDDLDGQLPLNRLITGDAKYDLYYNRFVSLCIELALDNPVALADALVDWLDSNQDQESDGAENAYYLTLTPPYEATDGPLRSIDDLHLVRGFDTETVERLRPFVNSVDDIAIKLNINTASPELLRSWDADTASAVEDLLARRAEGPFKKLDELSDLLGNDIYTEMNAYSDLDVKSSYYLISSQGRVNDGVRRMQAIVKKTDDKLLWQKVN